MKAKRDAYFEGIKAGLKEALKWAQGRDIPVVTCKAVFRIPRSRTLRR